MFFNLYFIRFYFLNYGVGKRKGNDNKDGEKDKNK